MASLACCTRVFEIEVGQLLAQPLPVLGRDLTRLTARIASASDSARQAMRGARPAAFQRYTVPQAHAQDLESDARLRGPAQIITNHVP